MHHIEFEGRVRVGLGEMPEQVRCVLGLLGTFITIPVVTGAAFWFVFAGFALLALATLVRDL